MFKFGICTLEQHTRAGDYHRSYAPLVSYALLGVGDNPTEEQIRTFESISFRLRTSNGTFRTSFQNRFRDVDAAVLEWLKRFYSSGAELHVQDRAVSHGLTSWEWAVPLFQAFPAATFEASDLLLELIQLTLPDGGVYIVEPNGRAIQYIRPPFVVPLQHPASWRYPLNRMYAGPALRRFEGLSLPKDWMANSAAGDCKILRIPYIHPNALGFSKRNPRFTFRVRSVFDVTPAACDVVRTMNIFNRSYFSDEQLRTGAKAIFDSLRPGGIWVVGRTLETDFSNHATLFRRNETGWEGLERIGNGWELEELALK